MIATGKASASLIPKYAYIANRRILYSGTCEEGAGKDLVARVRNLGGRRQTLSPSPRLTGTRLVRLTASGIRLDDETGPAPIIPPCGAAPRPLIASWTGAAPRGVRESPPDAWTYGADTSAPGCRQPAKDKRRETRRRDLLLSRRVGSNKLPTRVHVA